MILVIGTRPEIKELDRKNIEFTIYFKNKPDANSAEYKNVDDLHELISRKKINCVYVNCENALLYIIELLTVTAKIEIYAYAKCFSRHELNYLLHFDYFKSGDLFLFAKQNLDLKKLKQVAYAYDNYRLFVENKFFIEFDKFDCKCKLSIEYTDQQPPMVADIKNNIRLAIEIKKFGNYRKWIATDDGIANANEFYKFINFCFEMYVPTSDTITFLHNLRTQTDSNEHVITALKNAKKIAHFIKNKFNCDFYVYYTLITLSEKISVPGVTISKFFTEKVDVIALNVVYIIDMQNRLECVHAHTAFILDQLSYAINHLNIGGKLILHEYPLVNLAQIQIIILLQTLFEKVIVKQNVGLYESISISVVCFNFNGGQFNLPKNTSNLVAAELQTCKLYDNIPPTKNYIKSIYGSCEPTDIINKLNQFHKIVANLQQNHLDCIQLPAIYNLYINLQRYAILKKQVLVPIQIVHGGGDVFSRAKFVRRGGHRIAEKFRTVDMDRVILVPFADLHKEQRRDIQLKQFLEHMKRIGNKLPIVVVEQKHPSVFNKGQIYNAGVKWISENTPHQTVILHDVDLLPDEELYKRYVSPDLVAPVQLIPMSEYFKKVYGSFWHIPVGGGVTAISISDYKKVDGFPMDFWNWGGEDNAFQKRLSTAAIYYHYNEIGDFTTTDVQRTDTESKERYLTLKDMLPMQSHSPTGSGGISTSNVKILSIDVADYTRIQISFSRD